MPRSELWALENLHPWCIVQWDTHHRGPEERAAMLERFGFRNFAYDWGFYETSSFDAEIEAMKARGINIFAWWFLFSDPDDPIVRTALDTFARHDIRPQLWVEQSIAEMKAADWAGAWLDDEDPPGSFEEAFARILRMDEADVQAIWAKRASQPGPAPVPLPQTPGEQRARVVLEADRVKRYVDLAAPYGCKVELYNHGGWFGRVENQLQVIERLNELGVTDVGMVYNFIDARDQLHDDTRNFRDLWGSIRQHVDAVNITGMGKANGEIINLSQGDGELEMMRVIQESGWAGPVGLYAHDHTRDVEATLMDRLRGLEWLRAELERPGSGGPPTDVPIVGRR